MNEPRHNVDPAEVRKFESVAARWWDPESEFKPLHDINPVRVDYLRRRLPLDGARVLDVGCGGGLLSEALAREGARVTGIDMGETPLAVARLHLHESGLEVDYQQATAEAFAEHHPGTFDLVTCLEVLEHVPDPASTVAACARLAKPGGLVVFSTLNRTLKAYLLAILGAEYLLGVLPKGTHDYEKFIRPSELDAWARRTGLDLQDLTGLHYNPLTRTCRLVDDTDVNYLATYRRD